MASSDRKQPCRHENEELMVCIYPGCQAEDLGACVKCMLTGHQHGLYAIHSLAIRNKISHFMSAIRKREQLKHLVAQHYSQQRQRVLECLNQEQQQCNNRLQTMMDCDLADSLVEIDAGNLRDRKLVQIILEGKLPPANNLTQELKAVENEINEIMYEKHSQANMVNGRKRANEDASSEENFLSMKRLHKNETVLSTITNLVNSGSTQTEKQAQLLEEIQRLEDADLESPVPAQSPAVRQQPEVKQKEPVAPTNHTQPALEPLSQRLASDASFNEQEVGALELAPDIIYKELQYSNFLDASSAGNCPEEHLSIAIRFNTAANGEQKSHFNQCRAKSVLGNLSEQSRPESTLSKWNLQQIDSNLKSLPRLKSFQIEYYPQNAEAAHYAFSKLSSKGIVVVACPMQVE